MHFSRCENTRGDFPTKTRERNTPLSETIRLHLKGTIMTRRQKIKKAALVTLVVASVAIHIHDAKQKKQQEN